MYLSEYVAYTQSVKGKRRVAKCGKCNWNL